MVISVDYEEREDTKKSEKKKFFMEFFPCGFSISGIKKGGEVNSFRFAIRVEGKCEINLKKKKCFSPSGSVFTIFCRKFAGKDV